MQQDDPSLSLQAQPLPVAPFLRAAVPKHSLGQVAVSNRSSIGMVGPSLAPSIAHQYAN